MKKFLGLLLIFSILITSLPCQADEVNHESNIKTAVDFYKANINDLTSWSNWQSIVALFGAEENINEDIWELPEWSKTEYENNTELFKHIQHIIGGAALRKNPEDLEGLDLFDELLNAYNSGSLVNNYNFIVWYNIVANTFSLNFDKDDALQKLLLAQHDSGAFLVGRAADVDLTGMALTALSFYRGQKQAENAIQKALIFLKSKQLDTGAFSSIYHGENSNTTAVVITGLIDIGEDIFAEKWTVDGKTPLEGLLRFQLEHGGFKYKYSDTEPNLMSTNQALIALGDIKSRKSAYKRIGEVWRAAKQASSIPTPAASPTPTPIVSSTPTVSPTPTTTPTNTPTATPTPTIKPSVSNDASSSDRYAYIKVIGDERLDTMYSRKKINIDKGETPYKLLSRIANITKSGSGTGIYVKKIDGLGEFDRGPESGWKYTVNGDEPSLGANAYILKKGDNVVWFYYYKSEGVDEKSSKTNNAKAPTSTSTSTPTHTATPTPKPEKDNNAILITEETLFGDDEHISDWAVPFIKKAKDYGIIKGDNNGNVNPKQMLSRAELIVMLMRAVGEHEDNEGESVFSDIKSDSWYYGYVMNAFKLGIAKGKTEKVFDPLGSVTRQEAAAIISRILELNTGESAPNDIEDVSKWAFNSVKAVFGNGIMRGDGEKFNPMSNMTREMAIKIAVLVHERNIDNET